LLPVAVPVGIVLAAVAGQAVSVQILWVIFLAVAGPPKLLYLYPDEVLNIRLRLGRAGRNLRLVLTVTMVAILFLGLLLLKVAVVVVAQPLILRQPGQGQTVVLAVVAAVTATMARGLALAGLELLIRGLRAVARAHRLLVAIVLVAVALVLVRQVASLRGRTLAVTVGLVLSQTLRAQVKRLVAVVVAVRGNRP
jgi:hypothetical protein